MAVSEDDPGIAIEYAAPAIIHAGIALATSPVPQSANPVLLLLFVNG